MAFTHTILHSYRDSSATTITGTESVSADTEINYDGSVAGETTNYEVDWGVTRANLKSVGIFCDKAITIKTNDSGSPQETITIAAGQQRIWSLATDTITLCPFSNNITKLYITNSTAGAASVKVRALCDQTPA